MAKVDILRDNCNYESVSLKRLCKKLNGNSVFVSSEEDAATFSNAGMG